MKTYIVEQVCNEEYGNTEVVAVFSTYEKAQAFVDANQYQWSPWWMDETCDALTITEWEIDKIENED